MKRIPTLIKWFLVIDLLLIPIHLTLGRFNTFFNLDYEANLPTIYQSVKYYLFAHFCLFNIWAFRYLYKKSDRKYDLFWSAIGFVLLALGIDELGQIHESLESILTQNNPELVASINGLISSTGYIGSFWVFYVIPFLLIFIVAAYFILKYALKHYRKNLKYLASSFGLILLIPVIEFLGTRGVGSHYYKFVIGEEYTEMLAITLLAIFVYQETRKHLSELNERNKKI